MPKSAKLCISFSIDLRRDAGTVGQPDLVKVSFSTRSWVCTHLKRPSEKSSPAAARHLAQLKTELVLIAAR